MYTVNVRREEGVDFGIPRLTIYNEAVSLEWPNHKQKCSAADLRSLCLRDNDSFSLCKV